MEKVNDDSTVAGIIMNSKMRHSGVPKALAARIWSSVFAFITSALVILAGPTQIIHDSIIYAFTMLGLIILITEAIINRNGSENIRLTIQLKIKSTQVPYKYPAMPPRQIPTTSDAKYASL